MDRRTTAIIAALGVLSLTIGTDFTGAVMLIVPIEHEPSADVTTTESILNLYALTFAMGIASAVLVPLVMPRDGNSPPNEPIDYAGIAVLSLAILGLLYALDVGADWGWPSWPIIGL